MFEREGELLRSRDFRGTVGDTLPFSLKCANFLTTVQCQNGIVFYVSDPVTFCTSHIFFLDLLFDPIASC